MDNRPLFRLCFLLQEKLNQQKKKMLNFGVGQFSRSIVIYLICLFLRVCVYVCLGFCLWVREHRACNEVVGVSMGMVGGSLCDSRRRRLGLADQPGESELLSANSRVCPGLRQKRAAGRPVFSLRQQVQPGFARPAIQTPLFSHTVVCFNRVGEQTWDAAAAGRAPVSRRSLSSPSLCVSPPTRAC